MSASYGKCYGCGVAFGFFKKEVPCKNCLYTFCYDCTSKKHTLPQLNNEKHRVCKRCFSILAGHIKRTTPARDLSPPANFTRSLVAQQKIDASSIAHNPGFKSCCPGGQFTAEGINKGMSAKDLEIAERLQKLKRDSNEGESRPKFLSPQQDIEKRLANLRGLGPTQPTSASTIPSQKMLPKLTEQEQSASLINEVCDEVAIDEKLSMTKFRDCSVNAPGKLSLNEGSPSSSSDEIQNLISQAALELEVDASKAQTDLETDTTIRKRLDIIRKDRLGMLETHKSCDGDQEMSRLADIDDGDGIKLALKQILEEQAIDDSNTLVDGAKKHQQFQIDPEELPWCCICNEDAALRCFDCEGDLYCRRCYREGHADSSHKTVKYKSVTHDVTDD